MTTHKSYRNKVDKSLQSLSEQGREEEIQEFYRLVRFNASYPELSEWFKTRGFEVNQSHVLTWWRSNRPRGEAAIAINAFTEKFQGQYPEELLETAVGVGAEMVRLLFEEIQADPGSCSPNQKLQSLMEGIRELRQASESLSSRRSQKEAEALKFDGAMSLKLYLEKTFKNTSFEDPIKLAIDDFLTNEL